MLRALRSLLRDRAPSGSLRRSRLSTAERSSSWRRRQQRCRFDMQRTTPRKAGESCRRDGRLILGETCSEPLLPSCSTSSDPAGKRSRLCSLTSDLEAQLQRLNFTEEEAEKTGAEADDCAEEKRRSSSLRRGDAADYGGMLERDFSVQSLTSIINEDCFFNNVLGIQQAAVSSLQG